MLHGAKVWTEAVWVKNTGRLLCAYTGDMHCISHPPTARSSRVRSSWSLKSSLSTHSLWKCNRITESEEARKQNGQMDSQIQLPAGYLTRPRVERGEFSRRPIFNAAWSKTTLFIKKGARNQTVALTLSFGYHISHLIQKTARSAGLRLVHQSVRESSTPGFPEGLVSWCCWNALPDVMARSTFTRLDSESVTLFYATSLINLVHSHESHSYSDICYD